ncbi:hypothetical protein J7E73_24360 [Paenibacillus albidus]|uniref:hypothetical protein n=1 Tax=Paenibacillus albidus TaxID=2041023 RepID=UPI001BE4EEE0|nr:hypothetical protein [Paenibacillus albidus]MBT2292208.1 hypothetical protein [Paenibacillus albidus]
MLEDETETGLEMENNLAAAHDAASGSRYSTGILLFADVWARHGFSGFSAAFWFFSLRLDWILRSTYIIDVLVGILC